MVYHDVAWAASGGVGFCEYNSVPECGAASKMWRRETRNRGPLLLRETIPELGRNRLDQPLTFFKGNDIIEWPHVEFAAAVFRHLERETAGGGGERGKRACSRSESSKPLICTRACPSARACTYHLQAYVCVAVLLQGA